MEAPFDDDHRDTLGDHDALPVQHERGVANDPDGCSWAQRAPHYMCGLLRDRAPVADDRRARRDGLFVLVFTRLLVKHQEGSVGTLSPDRVDVEPNVLFGVSLPGPNGSYPLDRFSAIRVEFRSGPIQPGVQGGPNEVIWLVGRNGTPNVALARTDEGAGRIVGKQFGAALGLPVEEVGAAREIRL